MALALHNGRVGRRVRRASLRAAVVLVACAGLLSGCSDDGKTPKAGDSTSASVSGSGTGSVTTSTTSTDSAGPTLPVPAGVELSPQGSQLQVGDTATVAWELRQGVVGVVDITRAAVRMGAETYEPLPPLLVAVALYAPIVFALVSLQRWIERRQASSEAVA